MLYDNLTGAAAATSARMLTFSAPGWEAGGERVQAHLRLSTEPDARFLSRLAITLLGAALAGTLLVSLGSFVLVGRGLRPLHALVLQMRGLDAGHLRQRLDGSGQPLELQPLLAQFNALMERLERAYLQLEGFNADVAHELQTPLATLTTSVEVAVLQGRYPDEVSELLGSNLEELQRLSGIIRDMLFLSQADRGQRARIQRVASVAALAHTVLEYHEAALADARLAVKVQGDAAGHFDAGLLKRALSNLVGNATRYATPETALVVSIVCTTGAMSLAVVNQGPPIAPAALPRLFDRFYRVETARSEAQQHHHGLGLSIVAAIARMHGGSVWARSEQGLTQVGLRLPLQGLSAAGAAR